MLYTVMYRALDGIVLSGSSTAEALEVDQEQISVTLSGSGTLTLAGQAINLTQSGSSTLKAFLLTTQHVNATLSASSNAELTVDDSLKVVLSGSSSLVHRGEATNVQQTVSGLATMQKSS